MANGRTEKQDDHCDYMFLNGNPCTVIIERILITENGKQLKKNKWEDAKKRNFCIYHSYNDEKKELFYEKLSTEISVKNYNVKTALRALDIREFPEEKRKKVENQIRNEHLLDFEGFYFPKNADFEKIVFEATVSFLKAEFGGYVSFKDAKFGGEASFREVNFDDEVDFKLANFGGVAFFELARFFGKVNFIGAKFSNVAAFINTKFGLNEKLGGDAFFTSTEFVKEAFFYLAKFHQNAYFEGGEFIGKARFSEATFGGVAYFYNAKFDGEADFYNAKFNGEARFSSATFGGEAYFNRSLFHKSNDFAHATFLKELDFTDAAFLFGKLDFTRAKFPAEETFFHNTVFNCEVLFHEQMLKGVRFTGCYLGSASFYGSDVRDAVFINSSWNRRFLEKQVQRLIKQKRIEKDIPVLEISRIIAGGKRRAFLLDEYIYQYSRTRSIPEKIERWLYFKLISFWSGAKSSIKKLFRKKNKTSVSAYILEPSKLELDPLYLEQLYCQFKLAMDRNKMYGLANDFYHGEKLMETKKLWEAGSPLKWAFLWLYRLLAGFGNSPWRAVISLIVILFATSCLLIKFNGLSVVNPKEAYERCPCKINENIKAVIAKPDTRQAVILAKVERSFISGDIAGIVVSLNTLDKFSKESKPGEIHGTGPPKKQAGYSLKCKYLCNTFHISLWNLTAAPGKRSEEVYKENGWGAYLAVFCIQYIFRPLMVALIIISVRRKVYRG